MSIVFTPAFSPHSRYVLRDQAEADYFASRGGAPEAALIEWATQFVTPETTFIDVGAHVGTWAQHMAPKCKTVYAFEPQTDTFQRLCAGVEMTAGRRCIRCIDAALGDVSGYDCLTIVSADGGGSTTKHRAELGKAITGQPISVFTLDTLSALGLFDDTERIGLIKIDAEGAEPDIIRGMEATLKKYDLPTLLVEAWLYDWYAKERTELTLQMAQLGYVVQPVNNWPEMLLATRKEPS